jgi:hypothetical protein
MNEYYESPFALKLLEEYSKIVSNHLKIVISTNQNWNEIGSENEKRIKNIFKKYISLTENYNSLLILSKILKTQSFPDIKKDQDVGKDESEECYGPIEFLKFFIESFKIKIITNIDIAARLILASYNLNYNFHKINIKHFEKEPKFRNSLTLSSYRSYCKEFSNLRNLERNLIIHEGEYESQPINDINSFTVSPNSFVSDDEYLKIWFESEKEKKILLLNSEIDNDLEKIKNYNLQIMDSLTVLI